MDGQPLREPTPQEAAKAGDNAYWWRRFLRVSGDRVQVVGVCETARNYVVQVNGTGPFYLMNDKEVKVLPSAVKPAKPPVGPGGATRDWPVFSCEESAVEILAAFVGYARACSVLENRRQPGSRLGDLIDKAQAALDREEKHEVTVAGLVGGHFPGWDYGPDAE